MPLTRNKTSQWIPAGFGPVRRLQHWVVLGLLCSSFRLAALPSALPGENSSGNTLLEIDSAHNFRPYECTPILPPARSDTAPRTFAYAPVYDPLAPVVVDVMIVYTPAARAWADANGGGIENVIAQGMARAQLALDNSQTYTTFRLVHSAEVAYAEVGLDGRIDLIRLQDPADGYLDEVHVWRDRQSADLVSLLSICTQVAGIAYGLSSADGNPDYGFSVVDVEYAGTTYTLAHELAHNLGCGHAIAQTYAPGPGIFSYSAGWRWNGQDAGKYCSIMSYPSGSYYGDGITRTPMAYFSSPAVWHNGAATGSSAFGDNARTIRELKGFIAQYRVATWETGYWDLGGNWRRLDWFGDYAPMASDGWIWHNRHGFLYISPAATPEDIWLYAEDLGWLWTRAAIYPYLYRDSDGAWLWYNGATSPRWFRNMTAESWEFW